MHWSLPPLAWSHSLMLAKLQLSCPVAVLRQNGAFPAGVAGAANAGAVSIARAAIAIASIVKPTPARIVATLSTFQPFGGKAASRPFRSPRLRRIRP
jgi:hypothetical protein